MDVVAAHEQRLLAGQAHFGRRQFADGHVSERRYALFHFVRPIQRPDDDGVPHVVAAHAGDQQQHAPCELPIPGGDDGTAVGGVGIHDRKNSMFRSSVFVRRIK